MSIRLPERVVGLAIASRRIFGVLLLAFVSFAVFIAPMIAGEPTKVVYGVATIMVFLCACIGMVAGETGADKICRYLAVDEAIGGRLKSALAVTCGLMLASVSGWLFNTLLETDLPVPPLVHLIPAALFAGFVAYLLPLRSGRSG